MTSKAEVVRRATLELASSRELWIGDNVSKRTSGIERWYCEGRFWELRRIYRAKCFGVTYDGCRSFGRHFKITQLFWTSKWCRGRIHASQNERCTRTSSSFGRGLSKHLDHDTEREKTTTLGLNWRSSGTAWAQSLRSPSGLTLMGEKFWRRMGESPRMGVSKFSSTVITLLVHVFWRHKKWQDKLRTCRSN